MIRYLKYLLPKRLPIFLTIGVIMLLGSIVSARGIKIDEYTRYSLIQYFESMASILIFLIIAVVIFEFSFKMRKVSVDQVYSFPIKRERFYLTRFIVGYLELMIPLTISYSVGVIIIHHNISSVMVLNYPFFLEYLVLLIGGLLVYSFYAFFFIQANNIIDGLVTLALATFAPLALTAMLCEMAKAESDHYFFIYEILDFASSPLGCLIIKGEVPEYEVSWFLIPDSEIFVSALAFVSMFFLPKFFNSEDCGQKSNSIACYTILFPVLMISLVYFWGRGSIILCLLLVVVTYLGYALHRRSFNLGKIHWLVLMFVVILEFLVFIIFK